MHLHTEQSYWWRSKFLSECAWIVTCVHARRYASMLGDVIRACMACEILVQLSTDTHKFEKYSRGATKYTRVTRTRASSLNRAVPYMPMSHVLNLIWLFSSKIQNLPILNSCQISAAGYCQYDYVRMS